MGGEHLVSWPVMKAMYKKYPDLAIIHFDAHTDLREDYEGEPLSHASNPQNAEHIGPKNVYSFGIRSGIKEEFEWAKQNGMHISKFDVLQPLKEILPTLAGRPVYVTIDIDVLDPAHAPGTGTVDAGGITSKELLASIHEIARSEIKVVGCDLVEVAPIYDPSEQTANTASKMIREMLLGWIKKFMGGLSRCGAGMVFFCILRIRRHVDFLYLNRYFFKNSTTRSNYCVKIK